MTADDILNLLEKRHADDVFYTEVSIDSGFRRMDAWSMRKSWAKPLVVAYEVKVSRSDFLRDHKMQEYMAFCNELYVVAPKGVLSIDELPEGCGYLEVTSTGNRLLTRKKAQYRECVLPEEFYRGLLFSKADSYFAMADNASRALARRVGAYREFERFAEDEAELSRVGAVVSYKFSRIQRENVRLTKENAGLQNVRKWQENFATVFGYEAARVLEYDDVFASQLHRELKAKLQNMQNPQKEVLETMHELQAKLKELEVLLGDGDE